MKNIYVKIFYNKSLIDEIIYIPEIKYTPKRLLDFLKNHINKYHSNLDTNLIHFEKENIYE